MIETRHIVPETSVQTSCFRNNTGAKGTKLPTLGEIKMKLKSADQGFELKGTPPRFMNNRCGTQSPLIRI